MGWVPRRAATVAAHTAKRTGLTRANQSGIFSQTEILLLGHHRHSGANATAKRYNRKELSAVVGTWKDLVQEIADGRFHPDRPTGAEWEEGTQGETRRGVQAPTLTLPGCEADLDDEFVADCFTRLHSSVQG